MSLQPLSIKIVLAVLEDFQPDLVEGLPGIGRDRDLLLNLGKYTGTGLCVKKNELCIFYEFLVDTKTSLALFCPSKNILLFCKTSHQSDKY
jgi:hypothetical protein